MNRVRKIASVIILAALINVSIFKVSAFLQLKESDQRYSDYLVEDSDIDVLFFGSSHIRHGIFPMELWNDYGISSFNLAANGSTIPVSYWTLVNALDYHTPKVVVLDVFDMWPGRICSRSWGQVHSALDFFPLSFNKFRMINDLFVDTELTDANGVNLYEKRWELLWDIGEYHTRWTDLKEEDFSSQSEVEEISAKWKGASPLIDIADRRETIYPESWECVKYDELSKEYLIRIIDLCKSLDIDIVLVNTGYDCSSEAKLFADSVYDIAEQYNVPYLDFTHEDIINFCTDLYSTGHNTHVNFSGAERITSYLGKYLSANYLLTDHRKDENYSSWWLDYQMFAADKKALLTSQSDIAFYLILLADDDYKTIIEIRRSSILYENRNQALLENLGVDYSNIDEMCNLLVIDNETHEVTYLKNEYTNGIPMDSCAGELCVWFNEDASAYGLYLDGHELSVTPTEENWGRMRISVINKDMDEVIDVSTFD